MTVFHSVEYGDAFEAAAFIAALSRVLASPAGERYLAAATPVEVLANVSAHHVSVYLSDSAAEAASDAFPPGPHTTDIDREAIPESSVAIVASPRVTALRRDDVIWRFCET